MRTTTDRPLRRLVTRMRGLQGKLRDAAVKPSARNVSPLVVRVPAYHEAMPMRNLLLSRHSSCPARRSYMRGTESFGARSACVLCMAAGSIGRITVAFARGPANQPIATVITKQAPSQRAAREFPTRLNMSIVIDEFWLRQPNTAPRVTAAYNMDCQMRAKNSRTRSLSGRCDQVVASIARDLASSA